MIFANQGQLSDKKFMDFAKTIGLDVARFKKDLADEALEVQIKADQKEAISANITGTPAIYVNGRMFIEDKTPEKISQYIERMLKKIKK